MHGCIYDSILCLYYFIKLTDQWKDGQASFKLSAILTRIKLKITLVLADRIVVIWISLFCFKKKLVFNLHLSKINMSRMCVDNFC